MLAQNNNNVVPNFLLALFYLIYLLLFVYSFSFVNHFVFCLPCMIGARHI